MADYSALNARLAAIPGYLGAVQSASPYVRGQVARQFAAQAGIPWTDVPSGAVNERGEFYDPNADHWYSDPRVVGPLAVGGASLGLGLFAAPASAAAGGSSAVGSSAPIWGAAVPGGLPAGITIPTAATSAAATTGGTMGLWSSVGMPSALNAGASIVGSLINAHAAGNASKEQAQAAQAALDFMKQQYGDAMQRNQPYFTAGTNAVLGLSNLLGQQTAMQGKYGTTVRPLTLSALSTQTPMQAAPQPVSTTQPVPMGGLMGRTMQAAQAGVQAPQGQVAMRAPNGQVSYVPSSAVGHYQSLGATVIGG